LLVASRSYLERKKKRNKAMPVPKPKLNDL